MAQHREFALKVGFVALALVYAGQLVALQSEISDLQAKAVISRGRPTKQMTVRDVDMARMRRRLSEYKAAPDEATRGVDPSQMRMQNKPTPRALNQYPTDTRNTTDPGRPQ